MMTSGSWRMALRRASLKLTVSVPSSRWVIDATASENRNSIGSSMVMTCTGRVWEMCLISAARVVDLPLPVGPVTSTSPVGMVQKSSSTSGQVELLDRLDLERDAAEAGGEIAPLHEDVAAEARHPGDAVAEVDRHHLLELALLDRGQDLIHHRLDIVDLERVGLERQEPAVEPQQGRTGGLQVEVRSPLLGHDRQQLIEVHRALPAAGSGTRDRARAESAATRGGV